MSDIKYVFSGEKECELKEKLTQLNICTKMYDKNDFVLPKMGTIIIPKEFETTWIGKIKIFHGWTTNYI